MRYFDKHGTEIKSGMTIFFSQESDGTGIAFPVIEEKGELGFFAIMREFIPLSSLELSNWEIVYIPKE